MIDHRRWPGLLAQAGFSDTDIAAITASPAAGALFAALRRGEGLGHRMDRVAAQLRFPLNTQMERVGDLAAVLHHRVETWLAAAPDLTGQARTPAAVLGLTEEIHSAAGDNLDAALATVDALIDARIQRLVDGLTRTRPAWLHPTATGVSSGHDPRPHFAVAAAYRDLTSGAAPTRQDQRDRQRQRTAEQRAWSLDR